MREAETRTVKRLDLAALQKLHVLTDCVLVSLGWLGAWGLRRALDPVLGPINEIDPYLKALPLIVVPWITTCWLFGIYRTQRMKTVVDELQNTLRGVALGLLVVSAIGFFFRELYFGRLVVLLSGAFNLVLQGSSRVLFHRLERRLRSSGACDVSALVVGTGIAAVRLLQKIQDHPETGYRVVGLLGEGEDPEKPEVAGHAVLGEVDDLRETVERLGVQEVFIADPGLGHSRMLSLVLDCEDLGVTFRIATNLFEVLTTGSHLDLVDDLPLVQLGRQGVPVYYEPLKRVFDGCSALVLGVLTAPLLAACALWVRLDSPGPAFFRQTRVGRAGRPFEMWKLRTMHRDVERYEVAPRAAGDPRITRAGRWLRSTSLDELPQLWNVLRGEMSLVGPRPEMPFVVETYDDWQRRRLGVKPGITGLWQILGRKDLPMHENLQYDFYYIRNRSLALDVSILIRTVGAVLVRRGAF
ncbi:MAG: sugar transferase [Myxococcota bacterium]|nr:sugar transferase [Myxococcota bacterium]